MQPQNTSSQLMDYVMPIGKGAIAGLVATGPMTATMFFLQHRLPLHQRRSVPPKRITMGVLHRLGIKRHMSKPEEQKTAWIAHFGYGTGMGTVYGTLLFTRKIPAPAPIKGMVYGLVVWAASYLGWLPAMELPGAATDESPRRNAMMIAAHLVWGGTLGIVLRALKG